MVNKQIATIYFAVLGIVTAAFGLADILVTAGAGSLSHSLLEIPGDLFRGGWGGFVVLTAGLLYLSGIRNFDDIHQFSKVVMGSIMIWIVAGCDIFAMFAGSIPGGDAGWFNTFSGFIGSYAPPYTPAVLLLPFSLVVIYYVNLKKFDSQEPGTYE
ncbi:conserved hypothetical protein [Methanohalobium evestigatum Z-7303]|uniref:Uncharacterized protein n=1 Tax=Methanohalobium evestigatum (strain ATCC BAA-1072 / DSM 3721 / NBRC 107634 / OCM 161 / Z-7303) TaxID=644295 RepID=D7E7R7_METEZ|nr:hypothetical protein [Methanohalobium evestigatum]ADI74140.1 conserved hypothetical protein [Methanohalobium evestigatum Z-7303]